MLTVEERKARAAARKKARIELKEQAQIEQEKNQPEVESITISIEWKTSRAWGANPHATADVVYKQPLVNGGGAYRHYEGFTCGGCGYDKESTVIAEIFNRFLKYKLYQKHQWKDRINAEETNYPYGVYYYEGNVGETSERGYISKPHFNGGVGTSCYYKIGEFIGGKFEHIASGKMFDVFKYSEK